MNYKIESGVPFPLVRQKYPFTDMQVGDCMSIPPEEFRAARAAAYAYARRTPPKKFAVRRSYDGKCRIWRIA